MLWSIVYSLLLSKKRTEEAGFGGQGWVLTRLLQPISNGRTGGQFALKSIPSPAGQQSQAWQCGHWSVPCQVWRQCCLSWELLSGWAPGMQQSRWQRWPQYSVGTAVSAERPSCLWQALPIEQQQLPTWPVCTQQAHRLAHCMILWCIRPVSTCAQQHATVDLQYHAGCKTHSFRKF